MAGETKKTEKPKGKLDVKGLANIVVSNHKATKAAAMALQKAVGAAGVPGYQVVVPGQKFKMPAGINKKGRKPTTKVSPQ